MKSLSHDLLPQSGSRDQKRNEKKTRHQSLLNAKDVEINEATVNTNFHENVYKHFAIEISAAVTLD